MKGVNTIPVLICSALVFAVSFMPWGSFTVAPDVPDPVNILGNEIDLHSFIQPSMSFDVTLTGWYGDLTLFGVTSPNWAVVAAALVLLSLCVLELTMRWRVPALLKIVLAVYGTVHLCVMIIGLLGLETVGIGALAALACFIAILVMGIKEATAPRRGLAR